MAQADESVNVPENESAVPPSPLPVDQQELVRLTVEKIVNLMGLRCRVEITYERDGYVAEVVAKRPATFLVGRRGEILDAIGFLAHQIASRQYPQCPPVTVDADGFRRRHQQQLRGKAQAIATIVQNTGREMAVDFLTEEEFRIVKEELRSNRAVRVHAVGDGERRNVIISPAAR